MTGIFQRPNNTNPPNGHPLQYLTDPSGTIIVLELRDINSKTDSWISPSGITVYTISYRSGGYNGTISRNIANGNGFSHPFTGSWKEHTFSHNKLEFFLPWSGGQWGMHPRKDNWLSDVGMLQDHEFRWTLIDLTIDDKVKFTSKCVDLNDPLRRDVCTLVMDEEMKGRVLIPLAVIGNETMLDELMAVASAYMDYTRTDVKGDSEADRRRRSHNNMLAAMATNN